jgi:hypothetical protein
MGWTIPFALCAGGIAVLVFSCVTNAGSLDRAETAALGGGEP